jgi:hypothetical protein
MSIGTFCVRLGHFFRFWYHALRKIWQPWSAMPAQRQSTGVGADETWEEDKRKLFGRKKHRNLRN